MRDVERDGENVMTKFFALLVRPGLVKVQRLRCLFNEAKLSARDGGKKLLSTEKVVVESNNL
jgi:hypothetical protein